jgi:hypothetical protein
MWPFLRDVFHRTITGFGERLAAFGPNLLAMLVTLVAGAFVAGVLHVLLKLILPRLGFDRLAERLGLAVILERGGIRGTPSQVLALACAWAVLAVFVLLAIAALDLAIAMGLIAQAFAYLPQLIVGVAILILGGLLAAFVRRSVLIAAVNAGLPSARLLAGGAHLGLLILFAAMALEHFGVGRHVILVAFTVLFGGVVLALALAFGLAGRDLARDVLERATRRGEPPEGDEWRHL